MMCVTVESGDKVWLRRWSGLPAHCRRRAGRATSARPGRHAGGLDVVAGGRARGLRLRARRGGVRRLTYWADDQARTLGWTAGGEVLAVSAAGQPSSWRTWAYAIPADRRTPRRLDFGPVSDVALARRRRRRAGHHHHVPGHGVVEALPGGTAGKLWWDPDGSGEFVRIAADLDGQLGSPMIVGSGRERRIAFLADHEGWGNVYSLAPTAPTCAGTPTTAIPAPLLRAGARTDGSRLVWQLHGDLWLLDGLDAAAADARGRPGRPAHRPAARPLDTGDRSDLAGRPHRPGQLARSSAPCTG